MSVPLSGAEEAVFQSLRWWRLEAAAAAALDGKPWPAFMVFSDVTLRELCRKRPATRQELLTVYGIGAHKLERFGTTLLLALTAACAVNNLPLGLSGGGGAVMAVQSSDGSVTLSPTQASTVRLSGAEEAVFQSLRSWRLKAAAAASLDGNPWPAFMVFSDVTLRELCRKRPATRQELLTVYGIGAHKLERFGTTLLLALTAACAVNNLSLGLSGSGGAAMAVQSMKGQVRKSQRYLSYGADIVCHILAGFTIAAGAGLHQQVVAVHQTDGQSVKFQFSHIVHRRICFTELQLLAYPCVKLHRALLADIGFCVNAEHRHAVAHLCE